MSKEFEKRMLGDVFGLVGGNMKVNVIGGLGRYLWWLVCWGTCVDVGTRKELWFAYGR